MDKYYDNSVKKEAAENAFDAAMAYEINCRRKYDRQGMPSLPPKKGEFMSDYAAMYGTTIQEMKDYERQVEYILGKND